jgi:peptide/nickel transport system substrate-binding protein
MEPKRRPMTRREFLRAAMTATSGVILAACGAEVPEIPSTGPTAEPVTGLAPTAGAAVATTEPAATAATVASSAKEAPQLAELVAAGKLPPLEQRLPKNPLMVKPLERVGQYGGVWRTAFVGGGDESYLVRVVDYENLVRWSPDWESVEPNVAESWETNDAATEFTFKLREGMRWSDGEPYTADDILFWYEDIFLNTELTPTPISWLVIGGEPVKISKVDDYTVKFAFSAPNGLLLKRLASSDALHLGRYPKHYLQQFHKKHNPDVDKLAKDAGHPDWVSLFEAKYVNYTNAELPALTAWKLTAALGENTTRVVAERNPYYWKVDTEGNQLPYIDSVAFDMLADAQVLVLKALNGEIDFMDRHLNAPANKPLFIDNQDKGGYVLFDAKPTTANNMVIQFNLTHPDPVKREVFQNKDFRIGLSHAINRQEIIDLVYIGQSEPYQAAPRPESAFYNERLARQYTEYDVAKANEHLDKVLSNKDGEGFRLGPDGKRFSFVMEIDGARTTFVDELNQIVPNHWKAVGIEASVKPMDRSLWETRVRDGSDFDATAHRFGGGSGQAVILDPRYWFPESNNAMYAKRWVAWYLSSESDLAEEPPAEVKKQMELYNQLKGTADEARQAEIMKEILEIAADQFYTIGSSLESTGFGIASKKLRNVPKVYLDSFVYPHPQPTNPHQWFYEA